jgi:hypothetical protein
MELHDLVDVSQVVGGAALFVSVLFLFFELRTNNRLTRAANNQALVGLSSPFHLTLIQDRGMAALAATGAERYHEMDEVDQYRYRSLLSWWLILYENIYYQWRRKLLDTRSFKPWANELRVFIRQQNLGAHWPPMKGLFQDQFADYLQGLIEEEVGPVGKPAAVSRRVRPGGPRAPEDEGELVRAS